MQVTHRLHKITSRTSRCRECAEPLSCFEGERYCANCTRYTTSEMSTPLECPEVAPLLIQDLVIEMRDAAHFEQSQTGRRYTP